MIDEAEDEAATSIGDHQDGRQRSTKYPHPRTTAAPRSAKLPQGEMWEMGGRGRAMGKEARDKGTPIHYSIRSPTDDNNHTQTSKPGGLMRSDSQATVTVDGWMDGRRRRRGTGKQRSKDSHHDSLPLLLPLPLLLFSPPSPPLLLLPSLPTRPSPYIHTWASHPSRRVQEALFFFVPSSCLPAV